MCGLGLSIWKEKVTSSEMESLSGVDFILKTRSKNSKQKEAFYFLLHLKMDFRHLKKIAI